MTHEENEFDLDGSTFTGRPDQTEVPAGKCQQAKASPCLVVGIGASSGGLEPLEDESLRQILDIVKKKTGHDFSSYKRTTVLRRIERRMTVREVGGLGKYIAVLEESEHEAHALYREILIGVTGFFRDEEAFKALRTEVIPRLFDDRPAQDPVRIWLPCCATGEEAYSVAILILEYLKQERKSAKVQLFATDIDEAAIARARSGRYDEDTVQEVGKERLAAFFVRSEGGWQCIKELRQMILFAHHSVVKDPPFSKLDLLVCRNFLIYLDPEMQKRLISLFHLVLKPRGHLFLGASETVGRNSKLFTPVDKKWKLYRRLENSQGKEAFFPFSSSVRKLSGIPRAKTPACAPEPCPASAAEKSLMERYCPPCLVVNEKYETLHVSTRTQPYLEVPVGEPTLDILRMAREELRPALRAAIYKCLGEGRQVAFRGVKLTANGEEESVNVQVEPLAADPSYGKLVLVILEPASPPAVASPAPTEGEAPTGDESSKEMLIRQLEEQLRITNEQLQATMEQLEGSNEGFMSANEELMSINEEFQSANEELQSTNEELETSKEELQALNEELITVNAELQGKVEELNQANGDMENLFASSGIAAIFLDRHLTIKRFSPAMAGLLNLIPADAGRPFRHLSGTIDWSGLPEDARTVLERLIPIDREVTSLEDSRRFIMRVLPYRTLEGNIDGIVVTLVDITELKRAEEEIRNAALFPSQNPSPVLRIRDDGSLLFSNRAAEAMLRSWRSELGKDLPDSLRRCIKASLSDGEIRAYDVNIADRCISLAVAPLPEHGYANLYGHDVTDHKRAEEALRQTKEEWERTFDSVPDLIAILDNRHRIVRVNRAMAERLGTTPEACIGQPCFKCVHGTDTPPPFCPHTRTLTDGLEHAAEFQETHLQGDFLVTTTPLKDEGNRMIGAVHVARDISEQKKTEKALLEAQKDLNHAQEVGQIGSWRLDVHRNALTWSDETYRIFGVSRGTPLSYERFLERIHLDDRRYVEDRWQASMKGAPYDIEHRICVDGQIKWVREKAFLELDAEGNPEGGFGICQDITRRKQTEEALRLGNIELEQTNRELESFIYSVSHDLRGPLRTISGFGTILQGRCTDRLDAQSLDYLSRICKGAEKMSHLIDDLLRLSKISRQEIERAPVNLSELAAGIVTELMESQPEKEVAVTIEAGLTADADSRLLEVLFSNLLRNAWKFTAMEPEARIRFGAHLDGAEKVYYVQDNGVGFDPAYAETMFVPFHRLHGSSEFEGTGVGLAIVERIIRRHGGRIWAEGREGEGATLLFTLGPKEPFSSQATEGACKASPPDGGP